MYVIAENHTNREEVVYSPDMQDKELESLLNKIGHKISESISTAASPTLNTHRQPSTLGLWLLEQLREL